MVTPPVAPAVAATPSSPAAEAFAVPAARRKPASRRADVRRDLAALCRYAALAVRAKQPLPAALRSIVPELVSPLTRKAVLDVAVRVEAGSSLSAALDVHPEAFDAFFVGTVRAGERSGDLGRALGLLCEWIEDTEDVMERVRTALVYPVTVAVLSSAVLLFLCMTVVPTFADVYAGLGVRLPWPTRIVFGLSWLLLDGAILWIPGLVAVVAAGWVARRTMPAKAGRLIARLPLFGPLLDAASLSRFAGTARLLLESGVPAVEALRLSAGVAGPLFGPAALEVAGEVERGAGLAKALRASGRFPLLFGWMVESAEGAGRLEAGLGEAAQTYGDRARSLGRAIPAVLEPLFLVAISVLVGLIVIGMFMPLFVMGSAVSG
jgi:type IV pilus assembly protein PilC